MTHDRKPSSSNAHRHYPALDGLRGLAALTVVVSHSANMGLLPSWLGRGFGQIGVACFFVLSGFLMMHIYAGREFTGTAVLNYSVRRLARVLPLYYLVVAFAGVWFVLHGPGGPFEVEQPMDLLRAAFLFFGSGVLWSVPVEVQFYVVFLSLWWAASKGRFYVAVLTLLGLQAALALGLAVLSPQGRLDLWLHFFIIGCLMWPFTQRTLPPHWRRLLTAVAWLLFPALALAPPELRRNLGQAWVHVVLDPFALLVPPLMLLLAVHRLGPFSAFEQPALCRIGQVSFSLYLLHMPILLAAKHLAQLVSVPPQLALPVACCVCLLVAWLSYRFVERPALAALTRPSPTFVGLPSRLKRNPRTR